MGVYIKGVEMPTDGGLFAVVIDSVTGEVMRPKADGSYAVVDGATAVPVPPHGRLIDADALWVGINKICDRRDAGIITDLTCISQILSALRHAPTIIEAEEDERWMARN